MARAPATKRKRDIREFINELLNDAVRSRANFTPEQIASYQEAYREAQEQRRPVSEMTPSRDLSHVVARRQRGEELELPEHMTRPAITTALNLAEDLEALTRELDVMDREAVAGRARRWTEWA